MYVIKTELAVKYVSENLYTRYQLVSVNHKKHDKTKTRNNKKMFAALNQFSCRFGLSTREQKRCVLMFSKLVNCVSFKFYYSSLLQLEFGLILKSLNLLL